MNTYLFNPTNDKYYAMILMRMDARKYTLTDYGYTLLRTGLSFLPVLLWISFSRGLPLWVCLLAPLHILSVKLAAAGLFLRRYEKTGVCSNENLPPGLAWGLTGILLGAAYALPALGLCLPFPLYGALALFSLVPGIFGIIKIAGFTEYRAMYQMLLAQKRCAVDVKQSVQTAVLGTEPEKHQQRRGNDHAKGRIRGLSGAVYETAPERSSGNPPSGWRAFWRRRPWERREPPSSAGKLPSP